MHSRAVFPLYDRAFPADHLYRIKETVPYADTCKREGTHKRSFLGLKEIRTHNKAYQTCYYRCHGKYLPVILENEHSEKLAQIYEDLCEPASVLYRFFVHPLNLPFLRTPRSVPHILQQIHLRVPHRPLPFG